MLKRSICCMLLLLFLLAGCAKDDLETPDALPIDELPSGPSLPEDPQPDHEPEQKPEVVDPPASLDDLSPRERLRQGMSINSYTYDMKLYINGHLQGTMRYRQHGSDVRIEGEADGQDSVIIMRKDVSYMLLADERQIIKMPPTPLEGTGEPSTPMSIESFATDLEEIELLDAGRADYGGLSTYVLHIPEEGSEKTILYLHPDYGFPLRLETLDPMTQDRLVMEIHNFVPGAVDPSYFELPQDWEVIDVESMLDS